MPKAKDIHVGDIFRDLFGYYWRYTGKRDAMEKRGAKIMTFEPYPTHIFLNHMLYGFSDSGLKNIVVEYRYGKATMTDAWFEDNCNWDFINTK